MPQDLLDNAGAAVGKAYAVARPWKLEQQPKVGSHLAFGLRLEAFQAKP